MAKKIKLTRGNRVFGPIAYIQRISCAVDPTPHANDIFLHALFARITLTDGSTVEFETKFNHTTNTIELIIPDKALNLLNQLTGIQRGPNFQTFINWLIGSQTLIVPTDSTKDPTFVPSSDLQVWFGATSTLADENRLTLELPTKVGSVIGHNLKTNTSFDGSMQVFLVWTFICGSNTSYDIRAQATVSDSLGGGPVNLSDDITISTFNLVPGDIRETELLNVPGVGPNNIVNLLLTRNFDGSPDPKTESVGILGIRIKLNSA